VKQERVATLAACFWLHSLACPLASDSIHPGWQRNVESQPVKRRLGNVEELDTEDSS
jgi:hypothetical protein